MQGRHEVTDLVGRPVTLVVGLLPLILWCLVGAGTARARCSSWATSLPPRANGLADAAWDRPVLPMLGPNVTVAAALLA
jgi:hypothetical protein